MPGARFISTPALQLGERRRECCVLLGDALAHKAAHTRPGGAVQYPGCQQHSWLPGARAGRAGRRRRAGSRQRVGPGWSRSPGAIVIGHSRAIAIRRNGHHHHRRQRAPDSARNAGRCRRPGQPRAASWARCRGSRASGAGGRVAGRQARPRPVHRVLLLAAILLLAAGAAPPVT